jgi:hypothetical protein
MFTLKPISHDSVDGALAGEPGGAHQPDSGADR